MEKLVIFGTGSLTPEVVDFVERYKLFEIIGYTVDNAPEGKEYNGLPVFPAERLEEYIDKEETKLFIAISWYNYLNRIKRQKYEQLKNRGFHFANLISPLATVLCEELGEGNWICDYAYLSYDTHIGDNNTFRPYSFLAHHVSAENHNVFSGRSVVAGSCIIGNQNYIGINSTVFNRLTIGDKCIVGGAAVVQKSMPSFSMCKAGGNDIAVMGENAIEGFMRPNKPISKNKAAAGKAPEALPEESKADPEQLEKLEAMLCEKFDDIDFKKEKHLISDGILDSLKLVEVITVLEEKYGITVDYDKIGAAYFDSTERMLVLIDKYLEKSRNSEVSAVSLVEALKKHSELSPDKLFIANDKQNEYTYAESWKRVCAIAGILKNKYFVNKQDCVAVQCNQSAEFLFIKLACELIGSVFVPIEENASMDRINDICTETECRLIISDNDKPAAYPCAEYADFTGEAEADFEFTLPEGDEIAELLYTTGTTGKSKGIAVSHRANIAVAENILYGVKMTSKNVELLPLPLSHSHSLRSFYANLLNGCSVVLINGIKDVAAVFELLEKYRVTALDAAPSALQLLLKLSKDAFWKYTKRLDYIEIGTAALPEELKNRLIEGLPNVRLYNFYGSTESGRSCVLDFSSDKNRANCIGKPSRNSTIIFTDEERKPKKATREDPGLLASGGLMNMEGYWKNPELTASTLKDGLVYSNDIGYADEEGYIYVLGRRDDVINYNGIKIAPHEIEEVAVSYSGIGEAICVGKEDTAAGQVPVLFIVIENTDSFSRKAFLSYLQEHIDKNKLPRYTEEIEQLPRTYNGKVDRKVLVELTKSL